MPLIKKAFRILDDNIKSTRNVTEWGKLLGFHDLRKFSLTFRREFGYRPQESFHEIRVKKIIDYLACFPSEKNYCVAIEFSFNDEQGLYKYLKRHTKLSPTELKLFIQNGQTKRTDKVFVTYRNLVQFFLNPNS